MIMEEKYQSALNKILKLAAGNQEFGDELRKRLNVKTNQVVDSNLRESAKLDHIYEYCIKQILQQQASLFYAPFKEFDIYETLVSDYVRMEDFRRKDNFEDYGLALYQQIENIINMFYANPKYLAVFKSMINSTSYVPTNKGTDAAPVSVGAVVFGSGNFYTDGINNLSKNQSTARERVKLLVYALMFFGEKYDWKRYSEVTDTINKIYLCRNKNHRGGIQTENAQKTLAEVEANTSWAYFEFSNALVEFVRLIKSRNQREPKMFERAANMATITSIMPGAAFVTIDGQDSAMQVPQNLFGVVKAKTQGDKIKVLFDGNTIVAIL